MQLMVVADRMVSVLVKRLLHVSFVHVTHYTVGV